MAKYLLVGFLGAIGFSAFSQDLLVDTASINYTSNFEKTSFKSFANNSPDYFALLLSPDETVTAEMAATWKSTFNKEMAALKPAFDALKKNDKKVKFLYEKVHTKFLTKYELTNVFSQVFKDGIYNCVSATALYSLVFDYFKIPYAIQEKPTHVYLIAYPDAERIQIETTTPIGGYRVYDQAFKQSFVKKLTDVKLISSVEYQTKSVDELFDKFYFEDEAIDIQKLIGLQYENTGLYLIEKDETMKAFDQFEKSYFFYPTEKSRYLMYNVLLDAFNKASYGDEKKARYLAMLCQFKKEGITDDQVKGEFARITQKVLIEEGKHELYAKIHSMLQKEIADSTISAEIAYVYNFENGRIAYTQGLYRESLPFFQNALRIKMNSSEMTGLFVANVAQLYTLTDDKKTYLDSLKQFATRFPNLNKNSNFTSLTADVILELFARSFEKGNPKLGDQYRLTFEDYMSKNSNINRSLINRHIGTAYSTACSHYFKIGQTSKARAIVDKGLSYVPDDFQLRSRREMLR